MSLFLFFLFIFTGCLSTATIPSSSLSAKPSLSTIQRKPYQYRESSKSLSYRVKKGDTLWSISKKFNIGLSELRRINNITHHRPLQVGDILVISSQNINHFERIILSWPTRGKIISYFGERRNGRVNKGIDIKTAKAEEVKSSLGGKIVFNNYLKGYGHTLIIEHTKSLSTVYSNLSEVSVEEGSFVDKGQAIARAGKNLISGIYLVHFEVRSNQKALNPLDYLKK